jgi:tetratricopeptide (TPR) repeat protein
LSAKTPSDRQTRNLLVGGGIGVVVLLLIWGALGSSDSGEVGQITSASEYVQRLKEVQKLSKQHLEDFDEGVELTEADKDDLRKSAVLFDRLIEVQPTNIAPYLGAGKTYQALGNEEAAIKRFQQGLATVQKDAPPAVLDTAIEMHYLFSKSLFNLRLYKEALAEINIAIKAFTLGSPIYLSQRASIYVQMRKYKEARIDLLKALEIDPQHKRSQSLLKFLILNAVDEAQSRATKKLNKKDYKGAIAECNEGLRMSPNHLSLIALRGAAYLGLGDKPKAAADADTLEGLDPGNADAKTLRNQLKK